MNAERENGSSDKRIWTDKEISDFIVLAKERRLFADTASTHCRNKNAFEAMKEDMEKLGHNFTMYQLRRRWKSLKHRYYKILSRHSKKDNWQYFDAMHEILESCPNSQFLRSRFGHVTEPDTSAQMKLSGSPEEVLQTQNAPSLYQTYAQNLAAFMTGPGNLLEERSQSDEEHQFNDAQDWNRLLQMDMIKVLKEATKKPTNEPDRFDRFGIFIASYLRSMTEEKSDAVMKNLSRTLFEND